MVDRFKNSRALFEKLEKENSGPVPSYKTGTAFKRPDIRGAVGVRRGLGEPTSYSAGSAQVKKTANWIKSLDNKSSDSENKDFDNQPKSVSAIGGLRGSGSGGLSDYINSDNNSTATDRNAVSSSLSDKEAKPASNGHVTPSSPKSSAKQTNGFSADSHIDDTTTNGFPEPKSEPVATSRNIFNRQLSSDVLPKPYHAPTAGIRSVRRPDPNARLRYGGGSSDKGDDSFDSAASGDSKAPVAAARKYPLDKSLSKEDIAASLAAADKYLNKIKSGDSGSAEAAETEEPLPWRSTPAVSVTSSHPNSISVESGSSQPTTQATDDKSTPDESNAYDNVADVLTELRSSGHPTPNTQSNNHVIQPAQAPQQKRPWERDSIVETCVDDPLTPRTPDAPAVNFTAVDSVGEVNSKPVSAPTLTVTASADLMRQSAQDHGMDYDPVPNSASSVYLESKLSTKSPPAAPSTTQSDHHYNNIGAFLESKKRRESLPSDDEPYEVVAPPTPPSRRAPANLPLAQELDEVEPMSTEEASRLLSTR